MEGEVWKESIITNGAYSVSNLGRVRSNERIVYCTPNNRRAYNRYVPSQICKQHLVQGYLKVHLCMPDGTKKMINVHRLVAEAFIPNPQKLSCINHKSEKKIENFAWNLEWCDHKYNNNYGTRNERMSKAQRNMPSKSKRVLQLDLDGNLIKEWESICELGRAGFDRKGVSRCCRNMPSYITSGGYKWKFV